MMQPTRHESHACCVLRAEKYRTSAVLGTMHDIRVSENPQGQVTRSAQGIFFAALLSSLRGLFMTGIHRDWCQLASCRFKIKLLNYNDNPLRINV